MSFSLFTKIIDDLQEFKHPVKTIRLYGFGEPLMNKDFCSMVRYAKKSDKVLKVDTTTNASLLNPSLIENLIDSGIDRINVSISAVATEKYRKFTKNQTVSYEKIVELLRILFISKSPSLALFIKADGDLLSDEEKKIFIDTFTLISDGCALEHTMSCWNDFEVADANKTVGIYGQLLEDIQVCPYIFYSFMVQADGCVSSCFLDWNKKLAIGDAKNESLCSLWHGKPLNELRKMMLIKNRKQHPVCRSCSQLKAGMPVNLDPYAEDILKRVGCG
jgi:radical SAM protein with 4Fe4S-binding SPASM domain